jgi:Ino eighty subunit 1
LEGDDIPPEIAQLMNRSTDYEDFGETAHYYLSVTRKAIRRLDRWDWEKINGPSKDRKKAREDRQKAFQNGTALLGAGQSRSARSRPRPPRRKPAPSTSTPSRPQKPIAPKDAVREALAANEIEKGDSGKANASPSRDYEESFVEKDVLGEGSGHDDDDSEHDDEGDDSGMEYPLGNYTDSEADEVNGDPASEYPLGDYTDSEADEVNGDGEQGADEDEVMEDQ